MARIDGLLSNGRTTTVEFVDVDDAVDASYMLDGVTGLLSEPYDDTILWLYVPLDTDGLLDGDELAAPALVIQDALDALGGGDAAAQVADVLDNGSDPGFEARSL